MADLPFAFDTRAGGWAMPDDPQEYARRAWEWGLVVNDLASTIEMAASLRSAYDALLSFVQAGHDVPDDAKIAIYDALSRKPPRQGKGETVYRNGRLRAIAGELQRHYGLTQAGAAAVLHATKLLPISKAQIANIISG
jgi:hypothetical protein